MKRLIALILPMVLVVGCQQTPRSVVIGSKVFTEGIVLGEVVRHRMELAGIPARHQRQLGGTQILWNALLAGEIDAYVDYTGTIAVEILGGAVEPSISALRSALAAEGVAMSDPLGLANTYALGMKRDHAAALGVERISDLGAHALQYGFSNEFLDRQDGWPGLSAAYDLPGDSVTGLDHDLAYRGLAAGNIDVTDLYSTDAEIQAFDLVVLEDDRGFFPDYRAVVVYRSELGASPDVVAAIDSLAGTVPTATMVAMNAAVRIDGQSETQVAAQFVERTFDASVEVGESGLAARLWRRTLEHLALVALSLTAAILVAIPVGVLAAKRRRLGAVLLGLGGVLQTVPSLALLVFLIPALGIGAPPAVAALFLYSLLPILRNTANGLTTIPRGLIESAEALGLGSGARLRWIELPMASPAILTGIKTAAVINVGTATLGALIGAGGYGQPILTGIRLDDTALILEGAIPAALLALVAQALFGILERLVVPRGLTL